MNRIDLIGRIATELELKFIPTSGKAVTQFSLAVTDEYRKAKGEKPDADFFNVVVFGSRAESLVTYMKKGKNLAVCGRLRNRNYEDKHGIRKYITEVIASEVHFIDWGGNKKENSNDQNNCTGYGEDITPVDDGDIPF